MYAVMANNCPNILYRSPTCQLEVLSIRNTSFSLRVKSHHPVYNNRLFLPSLQSQIVYNSIVSNGKVSD